MLEFYTKIKNWFIGDLLKETDDYYEIAKINLNFNFPFFTLLLYFCLSTILIFLGMQHSVETISGVWIIAFFFLFLLKYSKNIKISSFVLSVIILIITILNLFLNKEILHLSFPYWLSIQILFVVFNTGFFWGIIFGAIGGGVFIFYRRFNLFETVELLNFKPSIHLFGGIIEVIVASFLLLYLIYLYLQTSKKSEIALKNQNQLLIQKNELIEIQNNEKTIMLREIHHRVKNNLQVINSMLSLQSKEIKDPESLEAFDLSQKRIHAMALIHERLYMIENLQDSISASYLELLINDLVDLYKTSHKIVLKTNINTSIVSQKNIVPFGLILNEIISNTLKHGFKEEGTISINTKTENNTTVFEYFDDGKGFDNSITKGFGFELIEALSEQIDGKLQYGNNHTSGVHFIIEFK